MLASFLAWVEGLGISLYPAQEEAILEIMAGNHLILTTPTGSGKSLVAVAVHYRALCQGKRSYYTSPIKALVSEKFFELCKILGPENVGMITGDASIHPGASVICCTAEILSNMVLAQGSQADVDFVVMDEFHFFADKDRGVAWQLPLLGLTRATFVLMSATLGDVSAFEKTIQERTGRSVCQVHSMTRPVPLEFQWCDDPLHDMVERLLDQDRAPIYLVSFSQREAAETAQNLVSMTPGTKAQRQEISQQLHGVRFSSVYGKDMQRFLRAGIGVHHAGLLPRYRRLVERLAQQGLLRVISGTDTLGVGINVPIRTVLLTKLCKYDGTQTTLLSVRDFLQIAGRAGRKGFDDQGWVVAMAPEHVIENKKIDAKIAGNPALKKKLVKKKPPDRGYVPYDEQTFVRLRTAPPETLQSSFRLSHDMMLNLLQREVPAGSKGGRVHGYRELLRLIDDSYERPHRKAALRREAAALFRGLKTAGVVVLAPRAWDVGRDVVLAEGLERDFSLYHALSLWILSALEQLDVESESFALDVLSLVEAVLENPGIILERQASAAKTAAIEQMKADGVEYEERMRRLEEISWPRPLATEIYDTFNEFRRHHPWVGDNVRPKSIARDMRERWATFNDYVKDYGLARGEGVLLRYLNEAYKTLVQTVPERWKTDGVVDLIEWLRTTIEHTDSSLLEEWEAMHADPAEQAKASDLSPLDEEERAANARRAALRRLRSDPKARSARARAEMHKFLACVARSEWDEAAVCVDVGDGEFDETTASASLEALFREFFTKHGPPRFDAFSRLADKTDLRELEPGLYLVQQTLCDRQDENDWYVAAHLDLRDNAIDRERLLRVVAVEM